MAIISSFSSKPATFLMAIGFAHYVVFPIIFFLLRPAVLSVIALGCITYSFQKAKTKKESYNHFADHEILYEVISEMTGLLTVVYNCVLRVSMSIECLDSNHVAKNEDKVFANLTAHVNHPQNVVSEKGIKPLDLQTQNTECSPHVNSHSHIYYEETMELVRNLRFEIQDLIDEAFDDRLKASSHRVISQRLLLEKDPTALTTSDLDVTCNQLPPPKQVRFSDVVSIEYTRPSATEEEKSILFYSDFEIDMLCDEYYDNL